MRRFAGKCGFGRRLEPAAAGRCGHDRTEVGGDGGQCLTAHVNAGTLVPVRFAAAKRRISTFFQKHLINPRVLRQAGESGSPAAVLETTGRNSGLPRQIPILAGLQGDVLWIAAHHGRSAAWVKNVGANPRVRVRVGGRWRTGTATVVPGDETLKRVGSIDPHIADRARQMGTDLLTVRVDLDPVSGNS